MAIHYIHIVGENIWCFFLYINGLSMSWSSDRLFQIEYDCLTDAAGIADLLERKF